MPTKRYWLRGTVITCLVVILLSVLLIPFGELGLGHVGIPYSLLLFAPGYLIVSIQENILGSHSFGSEAPHFFGFSYLFFVYSFIFYALLGALIGWIYGKIKESKSGDD